MDWAEVVAAMNGLTHIATADANGRPNVAVVSAIEREGSLWVSTRRSSRKARNLATNPMISLMWDGGAELYVQGRVDLVDELDVKQGLWTQWPYNAADFFQTADNPELVLIKVTPTRALLNTISDRGHEQRVWTA
jgi:general stress protein 26